VSYLRVALQRETEQRGLNQAELARRAGLSRSYISRLMSGENADLSDQNFVAILKVFSSDPRAQAELVGARCMDVRIGPGSELVEILIKALSRNQKPLSLALSPDGARETAGRPGEGTYPVGASVRMPEVHLSQETERAFAWLRSQCPINADLEKHLVGYAKLTGMK
jgi:transcriptional regulator with XRE-family HTH domain